MATSPPFGLILPSRPVLVNPAVISPTQYAFAFPSTPAFTHIVVFLLPGNVLPDGTLAGIYVQLPGPYQEFRLLGALGTDKQSIILKATGNGTGTAEEIAGSGPSQGNGAMDEMADNEDTATATTGEVAVGIAIEPAATIAAQLGALKDSQSTALTPTRGQRRGPTPLSTKILAQRIIKNAFNFLASFAGTTGVGAEEVVPLKSFQDWWSKFERRIEHDPSFLEREIQNY